MFNNVQKSPFLKEWNCEFYFIVCILFYLASPCSMWDLGPLTRDQTCAGIKLVPPSVEAWSLNHWTIREVPQISLS